MNIAAEIKEAERIVAIYEKMVASLYEKRAGLPEGALDSMIAGAKANLNAAAAELEELRDMRPGNMAAAFAEEAGIDYSTALRMCNMD